MAAQEYYNPQAYAAQQQAAYSQPQQSPYQTQQAGPSQQHLPYNIADYKPPVPPDTPNSYPQQAPPPYSVLPAQNYQHAPSPPVPAQYNQQPYQQQYSPRPSQPQYLAPPLQNGFRPSQPPRPSSAMKPPRSNSEPPEDRKHRRHRRHSDHSSRRRSRSRSRTRSRSRSDEKSRRVDNHNRNTFLGAGGGALIGDAIFPGLGTIGGAILGGWGGHEATARKSRSAGRR